MGRLRTGRLVCAIALCGVSVGLLSVLGGCGGHASVPRSPFPAKITLTPGGTTSLQLGSTLHFSASATNSANTNINVTITFQSNDTSLLNFAPGGTACAGVWTTSFTVCVPGASGVVQVTATADGVVSPPTLVFVHPPIDNIVVNQVPPNPPYNNPDLVPCLSQGQTITLQATAYSQGIDVTSSVGQFNFSAVSPSVVTITPIITSSFNVVTNEATATAAAPGFTQIFASASGIVSTPFQQFNNNGPAWNFFETCPVQQIVLQLGPAGSQKSGVTTFVSSKGTTQTVNATVYDVLGNLMAKPPLTWTSTEPGAVSVPATCTNQLTCAASTAGPGAGIVTASCTPPSCNVGFPLVPANLLTDAQLNDPQLYVPVPVYAATAISGVVTGTPTTTGVIASSLDCTTTFECSVSLYDVSTSTNIPGTPVAMPTPPNSLLFDAAGDKAYVGSNFGVFSINPANIGSASNPFGGLGTFTGQILAVSSNGQLAVFADNVHTPNQVFITNSTNASSPTLSSFTISGAVAAAFSPDALKAYIVACVPGAVPCSGSAGNTIFVYSTLQSMQTIPLTAPASAVAFSSSGAFAFVTGGSTASAVTTFNTCNNALSTDYPALNPLLINNLPALPVFLNVLPAAGAPPPVVAALLTPDLNAPGLDVLVGLDNTGIDLIATDAIVPGFGNPPTSTPPCPQYIEQAVSPNPPNATFTPVHFNFGVGTFNPISFFVSPDGTRAYVVTTNFSSILVFDFNTGSLSGSIPLANNAIPVSASFTEDGTLIYVAANDGTLHEINTISATDLQEISFPNLPNVNNPFCGFGATTIACTLDLVSVKP
jgi:WD40 repeat protein